MRLSGLESGLAGEGGALDGDFLGSLIYDSMIEIVESQGWEGQSKLPLILQVLIAFFLLS